MCSDDLEHLNFHGFFERFYIENGSSRNQAIDEEQIESSGDDRGRTPMNRQTEDIKNSTGNVNFIMDDEGEQSMGLKVRHP